MISENTTFQELKEMPELAGVYSCLVAGGMQVLKPELTLEQVHQAHPTWSAADMVSGLERLVEIGRTGRENVFSLYPELSETDDPRKREVKLIWFPAESRRYVILASGGAYGAVCNLAEAFPAAAKLNAMGITVFCLDYRVGPPDLFPGPMEDLIEACRFLQEHTEEFGIDGEHYAIGGFSAGGHVAALSGISGYRPDQKGLKGPECLFLAYAVLEMWKTFLETPEPIRSFMLQGCLGKDADEQACAAYEVVDHLDEKYPPTYLVQASDDDTVPIWNLKDMAEKLRSLRLPVEENEIPSGGHGFGPGTGTDAEGWLSAAVDFWDRCARH